MEPLSLITLLLKSVSIMRMGMPFCNNESARTRPVSPAPTYAIVADKHKFGSTKKRKHTIKTFEGAIETRLYGR